LRQPHYIPDVLNIGDHCDEWFGDDTAEAGFPYHDLPLADEANDRAARHCARWRMFGVAPAESPQWGRCFEDHSPPFIVFGKLEAVPAEVPRIAWHEILAAATARAEMVAIDCSRGSLRGRAYFRDLCHRIFLEPQVS
jgi:hypothetical protein